MASNHKANIQRNLRTMELADTWRGEGRAAAAYAKVLNSLAAISGPVRSIEDVEGLEGVGKKIRAKMQEIIETGSLKAAEEARGEYPLDAFELLQGVYGVGPVKARELINNHDISTIAGLRAAVAADPSILNDKQKLGLKYYEDSQLRIPRAEMEEHEQTVVYGLDERFQSVVVGSYRRGAKDSGDIDVLLTLPADVPEKDQKKLFKESIDLLKEVGYIVETLAEGPKKFMGFSRVSPEAKVRRLDMLMTPQAEFPYAILYFTGSQDFNVAFRGFAKDKGYTLNEHKMEVIREGVTPVPAMSSEQDIFTFLGLKYVEPNKRRDGRDVQPV